MSKRTRSSTTVRERIRQNESKKCDFPGCPLNRYGVSSMCLRHWRNRKNWGHPEGHDVKRTEYAVELAQVSDLVDRNLKTHKGIKQALSELQAFLSLCENNPSYPRDIYRLAVSGIPLDRILKITGALYLLREGRLYHHPFKSDRHFDYVLGHKALKLIPLEIVENNTGRKYYKGISPKAKRVMGETLRIKLGVLFMNVVKHILSETEREREVKRAMAEPLV